MGSIPHPKSARETRRNCLWCNVYISGEPVQGGYCSAECFDLDCKAAARFFCIDCDHDTIDEYHMLRDAVWAQTGLAPNAGMACWRCIEKRLNRHLTLDDFTYFPKSAVAAWNRHVAER